MNIAHIEETSLIYGPGIRFVIWVQGCSIRCKDCWNKEMWSFENKDIISTNQIFDKIKNTPQIEGVTILGGEPFDQYDELFVLVKNIRKTNLSIILYTGYLLSELEKNNKRGILDFIDILITGRYDKRYRTIRGGLIGSSNQEIHFCTDRYTINDLVNLNESEISIDENGKISILGYEVNDLQQCL